MSFQYNFCCMHVIYYRETYDAIILVLSLKHSKKTCVYKYTADMANVQKLCIYYAMFSAEKCKCHQFNDDIIRQYITIFADIRTHAHAKCTCTHRFESNLGINRNPHSFIFNDCITTSKYKQKIKGEHPRTYTMFYIYELMRINKIHMI